MLDWDDLRFFLAVARHGSLTAAAKELRVAQSTVGRRLASLEASLGVRLLQRTPDGYLLTAAGESVQAQAERVEAEALSLERSVSGRDSKLEGVVRIACTETFAAHVLGTAFIALQAEHPGIVIELLPTVQQLSMAMRDADLAVRLAPSEQHDLVMRRIGRLAFGLYASRQYLDRNGEPDLRAGCQGHRLITLIGDADADPQARWIAELAPEAVLSLRTGSHEGLLTAARGGAGLACLERFRGDPEPDLRLVQTPVPAPKTEIWLLVHRDSRQTPRIRLAMNAVVDAVRSKGPDLDPSDA